MKWHVNQLTQLRHKGLTIDEKVNLEDLKELNKEIRKVFPVHVEGRGEFSGENITFDLQIEGNLVLPCSRTLVDVDFPFSIHTTETYQLDPKDFGVDENLHQLDGEVLDLIPIIKENILLEIPMQIFSESNKAEGAPQSGKGWEVVTEEEKKDQIDPRLADLQKFFEK